MTPEQATEDIIELVYHSAIISPDPWVQEAHVETSIRDILEELLAADNTEESSAIELREAEIKIEDLLVDLADADATIESLRGRLRTANENLMEYTGK